MKAVQRLLLGLLIWAEANTTENAPDMGTIWAEHWSRHHLEDTLALYAPDAVFFTLEDRVAGKDAIRALFRDTLETYKPAIHMHRTFYEQSGNLAQESGDYEETLLISGQPKQVHGFYLMVLRRDRGHWLIAQQMWTGSKP